jgi:uncharacterized membrane protein
MDKEVAAVLLILLAIVGIFVSLQPLLPSTAEKFSELGVLGPNQTIANYPTTLKAGQSFHLYGYVGNHEGQVEYYKLLIKLGNQSTQVTNSTSATAPVVLTNSQVLEDNQSWIFPINMSLNKTGTNLKLIFELWSYNETVSNFTYTGLWDQLYVNVTI